MSSSLCVILTIHTDWFHEWDNLEFFEFLLSFIFVSFSLILILPFYLLSAKVAYVYKK